jgi:hypothetical protein
MYNALGYYALCACAALGATLIYALVLVLAALLVRETRDFYERLNDGRGKPNPGQDADKSPAR